jgi:membrane protease subunit HflC
MAWDGEATEILSRERQLIFVDVTARWRIADPQRFYEAVTTIDSARGRLSEIIDGRVRDVVGENLLLEMVRSSDHIIHQQGDSADALGDADLGDVDTSIVATMIQPDTQHDPVLLGRQQLAHEMLNRARNSFPELGIELIDVVVRQVRYSEQLTQSVYARMAMERMQLAQGIRSIGMGEKERWEGRTEQERMEILSAAYEEAEGIRAALTPKLHRSLPQLTGAICRSLISGVQSNRTVRQCRGLMQHFRQTWNTSASCFLRIKADIADLTDTIVSFR